MSNYSQITFFAPKDSLPSGNPSKLILGAQFDPEFAAIAIAIATKYDSASISTGPILFNAGTAALPSISFVGGTNNNTGIYLPSANTLGFAAGGVARGSVSSAGNWSVSAPGSGIALTVNAFAGSAGVRISGSGQDIPLSLFNSGHSEWTITNRNSDGAFVVADGGTTVLSASANGNVTINAPGSGTTLTLNSPANSAQLAISDGTVSGQLLTFSSALFFGTQSAHTFGLTTSGTQRLNIDQNGAITIASPSSGSHLTLNDASLGGEPQIVLGGGGFGRGAGVQFLGASNIQGRNWKIANQNNINDALEFTPSTALGGNTFSTPSMYLTGGTLESFVSEPQAANAPSGSTHQIGYMDAPVRQISASTTLSFSDRGKSIELTGGSAQTLTFPSTFSSTSGGMIMVVNLSGNSWTLAASGTLHWLPSGSTGSRTLANNGTACLWQLGTDWYIVGGGGIT